MRRKAALASLFVLLVCSVVAGDARAGRSDDSINLVLAEGPGMAGAAQALYLDVFVNQVATRRVMQVLVDAAGRLHAWPANLRDLGVDVDDLPQARYLALDAITDVTARYDVADQRLYLHATGARLDRPRQSIDTFSTQHWTATAQPGALLNYDLFATHERRSALSAATALRAFNASGVFESTALSRFDETGDSRAYIRLDTAWTRHSQDGLWTLSAGDFISGALSWTRPTRLGGVQLRRDFSLQPGMITYPIPQFFGEAALPSAIELYVDGVRRYSGEVRPGPFELTAPPAVTGAGEAHLLLTDALGRSRVLSFEFYNAARLLRRGLSDFSVEVGSVRRDYGIDSFDYRSGAAGSASLRHGLRDWLTLEAHVEGEEGLAAGGAGALLGLGTWGTLQGAYSRSTGAGGLGSFGYNWTAGGVVADYSLQRTHDDYRDLASIDGRAPPQRAERVLLGVGSGARGQWSLHYTRLDRIESGRFRSVGLNYSVAPRPRLSVFVSLSRELDDDDHVGIFAGLALSLGQLASVGAGADHRNDYRRYSAYASHPVPRDGGGGWAVRGEYGDGGALHQVEAGYRAQRAEWRAGLRSNDDRESVFAGVAGAVVLMERSLFLARNVDDGFALVSTDGVAGVPVLLENREIGRSDAQGHYLLTGLNAWQANRISIDPLQLPPQIRFDRERLSAVPVARTGVITRFGMRRTRAALLILHEADGTPVALGSRVHPADEAARVVGYDGQVYLEHLRPRNRIDVVRADGSTCVLHFAYADDAQDIPVIGPLRCEE